jgi:hypothetical protein
MQHPRVIREAIVKKVVARRGRLHGCETIHPSTTAFCRDRSRRGDGGNRRHLQTSDLDPSTSWRRVRSSAGVVEWLLSSRKAMPKHFTAILSVELARRYFNDPHADGAGTKLHHALQAEARDVFAVESGARAFFHGEV